MHILPEQEARRSEFRATVLKPVEQSDGLATSLVYYTTPHRPEVVDEIARTLGLAVAEES